MPFPNFRNSIKWRSSDGKNWSERVCVRCECHSLEPFKMNSSKNLFANISLNSVLLCEFWRTSEISRFDAKTNTRVSSKVLTRWHNLIYFILNLFIFLIWFFVLGRMKLKCRCCFSPSDYSNLCAIIFVCVCEWLLADDHKEF